MNQDEKNFLDNLRVVIFKKINNFIFSVKQQKVFYNLFLESQILDLVQNARQLIQPHLVKLRDKNYEVFQFKIIPQYYLRDIGIFLKQNEQKIKNYSFNQIAISLSLQNKYLEISLTLANLPLNLKYFSLNYQYNCDNVLSLHLKGELLSKYVDLSGIVIQDCKNEFNEIKFPFKSSQFIQFENKDFQMNFPLSQLFQNLSSDDYFLIKLIGKTTCSINQIDFLDLDIEFDQTAILFQAKFCIQQFDVLNQINKKLIPNFKFQVIQVKEEKSQTKKSQCKTIQNEDSVDFLNSNDFIERKTTLKIRQQIQNDFSYCKNLKEFQKLVSHQKEEFYQIFNQDLSKMSQGNSKNIFSNCLEFLHFTHKQEEKNDLNESMYQELSDLVIKSIDQKEIKTHKIILVKSFFFKQILINNQKKQIKKTFDFRTLNDEKINDILDPAYKHGYIINKIILPEFISAQDFKIFIQILQNKNSSLVYKNIDINKLLKILKFLIWIKEKSYILIIFKIFVNHIQNNNLNLNDIVQIIQFLTKIQSNQKDQQLKINFLYYLLFYYLIQFSLSKIKLHETFLMQLSDDYLHDLIYINRINGDKNNLGFFFIKAYVLKVKQTSFINFLNLISEADCQNTNIFHTQLFDYRNLSQNIQKDQFNVQFSSQDRITKQNTQVSSFIEDQKIIDYEFFAFKRQNYSFPESQKINVCKQIYTEQQILDYDYSIFLEFKNLIFGLYRCEFTLNKNELIELLIVKNIKNELEIYFTTNQSQKNHILQKVKIIIQIENHFFYQNYYIKLQKNMIQGNNTNIKLDLDKEVKIEIYFENQLLLDTLFNNLAKNFDQSKLEDRKQKSENQLFESIRFYINDLVFTYNDIENMNFFQIFIIFSNFQLKIKKEENLFVLLNFYLLKNQKNLTSYQTKNLLYLIKFDYISNEELFNMFIQYEKSYKNENLKNFIFEIIDGKGMKNSPRMNQKQIRYDRKKLSLKDFLNFYWSEKNNDTHEFCKQQSKKFQKQIKDQQLKVKQLEKKILSSQKRLQIEKEIFSNTQNKKKIAQNSESNMGFMREFFNFFQSQI